MADQVDPTYDPNVQTYLAMRRAREQARERKPSFKTVPKNFKYAWRLVWRSGRALVITIIGFRVFTQLVASGLILIAPGAIGGIRAEGFTLAGLLQLLPFFAVFAINSLFSQGTSQMQEYLNAKVQKTITDEVLDVAASVDLASYESPQFFDHLQRVENNALVAPVQLSQTILQLGPGVIGLLTATAALLVVAPLIFPVLLASIIPFVLIARAATKREFEFAKLRTLSDRQRAYLRSVLIGKDEAKEVRAFGSGGYLRSQYEKR
jgi:ATP-binding cassette subfamily B protein